MTDVKHTSKELLDMLKSYHFSSDEETFGEENMGGTSESESLPSEDDSVTSEEEEYPRESSSNDANAFGFEDEWNMNVVKGEKLEFTGNSGLQKDLSSAITPIQMFEHFFDRDIIMLMVSETNRYAQRYIDKQQLSKHARMQRWKEVTEDEMRKFLGIILLTELIKFPRIEDYWKKDPLFFHPLFHHIQMPYNRFSLILKNWHFCHNEQTPPGDRLYKISNLINMLFSNIQKMYTPGDEVAIDEAIFSHNGCLIFRKYNSTERHGQGIRMYKLCDASGYIWNASIHCGGKLSKSKTPQLNNSSSIIVNLSESLLGCGRVVAAGRWCSSIELASYLRTRKTEYCGPLKRDRKSFPQGLKMLRVKKGDVKSLSNSEGIRIFKYHGRKEIFMVSTFHGNEMKTATRSKRSGEASTKPSVIVDFNRIRSSIDLSSQAVEYYSPARKSVKWYRKVVFQLLNIAMFNSWVIYNMISKSYTIADFIKALSSSLLGNFNTSVKQNLSLLLVGSHKLITLPRKESGKIARKRCVSCYESIATSESVQEARKKAKRVSTECQQCNKAYCLNCFNSRHKS